MDEDTLEVNDPLSQHRLLADAWLQAEQSGLTVSFRGQYNQGILSQPNQEEYSPFVIAQDARELELLETGRLRGHIFEAYDVAEILDGEIGPREVSFDKRYFDGQKNTAVISYRGTSEDGVTYKGEWSFDPIGAQDFCTSGTFEMRRVHQ